MSGLPRNRADLTLVGEVAVCDFLPHQSIGDAEPTGFIILVKLINIEAVSADLDAGSRPDGKRATVRLMVSWD